MQSWIVYAANVESKDRKEIEEWMPLVGDRRKRKRLMSKKQWEYMKKNWN